MPTERTAPVRVLFDFVDHVPMRFAGYACATCALVVVARASAADAA